MAQGKYVMWAGAVVMAAAALTVAPMVVPAQQQSGQKSGSTQAIPDAPRPQALPDLKTITPAGAAVTAPAPVAPPAQQGPGTSLPASQAAPTGEPEDQGPPPDAGTKPFVLNAVQVNFVEVPFTVKDSKGQLVPGLTYRDVQVFENNVRQRMAVFTTDPFPLSVALVIDQSVTPDTMTKINNALGALQGAFTPYDEVSVFTYNNSVKQQTPFTAAQSPRLGVILERSKSVGREANMGFNSPLDQGLTKNNQILDPNTTGRAPNGTTANSPAYAPKEFHTLNDAILAAAQETTKAAKGRRRIVYVISDGKEYGSKAKEKDVIRYCLTNKVAVWATMVGDTAIPGMGFIDRIHLPLTMRDNVLPRYAGATAGQIDAEFRQNGIEKSFARITEEVRNQYTVGYYSREPMIDGKYRKIDVRVLRPNLTVIAKDGYYPTASAERPTAVSPTATP